MDEELESLVRRAAARDVSAFVALTRRFQHFAFGAALSLTGDFHLAEDIVQEAFLAIWSGLPHLREPQAFAGWLREIARRQAFAARGKRMRAEPLSEAQSIASSEAPADETLDQRLRAAQVLSAIGALADELREPATLYYLHDCSQQDIAGFLGLPLSTVNNRLHAARLQLKQRMLTMIRDELHANALPDDFAHRIGRLIEARGSVIEAMFDPAAMPDLLTELAVSDEENRATVSAQVIQRGAGVVRGIARGDVAALPRGATVLSSGRHTEAAIGKADLARILPSLLGPSPFAGRVPRLIETGIKAVDLFAPIAAGGSVALAGEAGAGLTVLMEELARRLSKGDDAVTLIVLMPPPTPPWATPGEPFSYAAALKEEGYSEGTLGPVRTFFLRGREEAWTEEMLPALDQVDTVIHVSRALAGRRIWPAIEPLTSRSRFERDRLLDADHAKAAADARHTLALLGENSAASAVESERTRKLQNYLSQPFDAGEAYTGRRGEHVRLAETIKDVRDILAGKHDDISTDAFAFGGTIARLRAK